MVSGRFALDEAGLRSDLAKMTDDELPFGESIARTIEEVAYEFGCHVEPPGPATLDPSYSIAVYPITFESDADMVLVVVDRGVNLARLSEYSVDWDDIAPRAVSERGGSFTRDDIVETMSSLVNAANRTLDLHEREMGEQR